MIQPEPFNAEAPPEALVGDITPAGLHYVRSNFALPAHDGNLEIGGAVGIPRTLTLDDLRAMPSGDDVSGLCTPVISVDTKKRRTSDGQLGGPSLTMTPPRSPSKAS
jgi:hypothetical protein